VERTHEEALGEVIKVLGEGEYVIPLATSTRVENTSWET
jgi:hypothetical protein